LRRLLGEEARLVGIPALDALLKERPLEGDFVEM